MRNFEARIRKLESRFASDSDVLDTGDYVGFDDDDLPVLSMSDIEIEGSDELDDLDEEIFDDEVIAGIDLISDDEEAFEEEDDLDAFTSEEDFEAYNFDADEIESSQSDNSNFMASISDPNGIEEQITQDYLTEVENLEHGTELATYDSMLSSAPTRYKKLRSASARLDSIAEELEKKANANMALARRIDKVSDVLDYRAHKMVADGKETMRKLRERKDIRDPEAMGGWLKKKHNR